METTPMRCSYCMHAILFDNGLGQTWRCTKQVTRDGTPAAVKANGWCERYVRRQGSNAVARSLSGLRQAAAPDAVTKQRKTSKTKQPKNLKL